MDWKKWNSRKLVVALLGTLVVVLNDKLKIGLGAESINAVVWITSAYMVGEGLPDAAGAISKALGKKDGNGNEGGESTNAGGPK